jgi:hypothetical protein
VCRGVEMPRTGYARAVPIEIQPEPPEEVRAALTRLLDSALDARETASAWWIEGVRENVEDGAGYGDAVAPPRSSRGATRA